MNRFSVIGHSTYCTEKCNALMSLTMEKKKVTCKHRTPNSAHTTHARWSLIFRTLDSSVVEIDRDVAVFIDENRLLCIFNAFCLGLRCHERSEVRRQSGPGLGSASSGSTCPPESICALYVFSGTSSDADAGIGKHVMKHFLVVVGHYQPSINSNLIFALKNNEQVVEWWGISNIVV